MQSRGQRAFVGIAGGALALAAAVSSAADPPAPASSLRYRFVVGEVLEYEFRRERPAPGAPAGSLAKATWAPSIRVTARLTVTEVAPHGSAAAEGAISSFSVEGPTEKVVEAVGAKVVGRKVRLEVGLGHLPGFRFVDPPIELMGDPGFKLVRRVMTFWPVLAGPGTFAATRRSAPPDLARSVGVVSDHGRLLAELHAADAPRVKKRPKGMEASGKSLEEEPAGWSLPYRATYLFDIEAGRLESAIVVRWTPRSDASPDEGMRPHDRILVTRLSR